jgi:hypothetical protein
MPGDVWTWTAIDADSKLIVSWHVGDRSQHTGIAFMGDLKARAVKEVDFDADYAMLAVNRVPRPSPAAHLTMRVDLSPQRAGRGKGHGARAPLPTLQELKLKKMAPRDHRDAIAFSLKDQS